MKISIKYKLLLIVILGILVLFSTFYFFALMMQTENLEKTTLTRVLESKKTFDNLERNDIRTLKVGLTNFMTNQKYKEVFLTKDRMAIYNASFDLFKSNLNLGITHFLYFEPNGTVILRVHDLTKYDDYVNRKSFEDSKESNSWGQGLDLGSTAFALRVVHPYLINDSLVGFVEFGEDISPFLNIMHNETGDNYIMLVEKKYVDPEKWKSVREFKGLKNNYDDMFKYVALQSTDEQFNNLGSKCYNELMLDLIVDEGNILSKFDLNNKNYVCGGFGIRDVNGIRVGSVVVVQDVTEITNITNKNKQQIFVLTVIASIIIGGFVLILMNKMIIKPLNKFVKTTNDVALGKFESELNLNSDDEMGELVRSLNKMIDELKKAKENQKKYDEDLEKEVNKKTSELNKKVLELEESEIKSLKMMNELKTAIEKQKQLEKIKTEFLSITSHELRTPITPMKAQLQMVLSGYFGNVTTEQKTSLDMVLRNAVRLNRLIEDILDISKLESGNMNLRMKKNDLNKIVKNAVETMELKSKEKNIKIELKMDKIKKIVLDEDRITQVITNLIDNSIKFTDSKGKISVEVIDQINQAIVKIKDNGIGISKEDQTKLFAPFMQVDSSMSRNHEGTGLGLAICKGIIANHGGKISIESDLGKGATIIFSLPYNSNLREGKEEVELFKTNKRKT